MVYADPDIAAPVVHVHCGTPQTRAHGISISRLVATVCIVLVSISYLVRTYTKGKTKSDTTANRRTLDHTFGYWLFKTPTTIGDDGRCTSLNTPPDDRNRYTLLDWASMHQDETVVHISSTTHYVIHSTDTPREGIPVRIYVGRDAEVYFHISAREPAPVTCTLDVNMFVLCEGAQLHFLPDRGRYRTSPSILVRFTHLLRPVAPSDQECTWLHDARAIFGQTVLRVGAGRGFADHTYTSNIDADYTRLVSTIREARATIADLERQMVVADVVDGLESQIAALQQTIKDLQAELNAKYVMGATVCTVGWNLFDLLNDDGKDPRYTHVHGC